MMDFVYMNLLQTHLMVNATLFNHSALTLLKANVFKAIVGINKVLISDYWKLPI